MRVLITGATGFVGSHLAQYCASEGATVVGLGRRARMQVDVPDGIETYLTAELLDTGQAEQVVRSAAPERVFHLAAEASVTRSWEDPASIIKNNPTITLNLLEAVRRHAPKARVLIAGSGEEYGAPTRLPVDEEQLLAPQNPYAVSKASADLAAGFFADAYGLHVARARAFNHTGPGQRATYVVASFARQIAEAEADGVEGIFEVATGNIDVRRDFTDVRDVVRAYWLALDRCEPGAYNVCSGRSTAIGSIIGGLSHHTRLEVRQRTDPKLLREHEVMDIYGTHDKLTAASDWRPEISLNRTLADTLDWWRERTTAEVRG